jgi:predicted secreted protein
MKTKAINSGDFFQVLIDANANPMIANNSSKNWPNYFSTSFKARKELNTFNKIEIFINFNGKTVTKKRRNRVSK